EGGPDTPRSARQLCHAAESSSCGSYRLGRRGPAGRFGSGGGGAPNVTTLRIASLVVGLVVVATLWGAGTADARNPPTANDPCSRAGRDTCGTTGIGLYDTYRYGIRWFGDYRNVATGQGRAFCIDLGYWYPSASYRYELESVPGLRNSAGQAV